MRRLIALPLLTPALAGAGETVIRCDSDLGPQRRDVRLLIMTRNFQAVHMQTWQANNAMGEKCNALAREILRQSADVGREMIDKKIFERKDPDLLFEYCSRFEEIGKLTDRPNASPRDVVGSVCWANARGPFDQTKKRVPDVIDARLPRTSIPGHRPDGGWSRPRQAACDAAWG
jgi:hypothetical protein